MVPLVAPGSADCPVILAVMPSPAFPECCVTGLPSASTRRAACRVDQADPQPPVIVGVIRVAASDGLVWPR